LRKPSDLGYANDGYDLPPLTYHQHVVEAGAPVSAGAQQSMFALPALTLSERIAARKASIGERVARAIDITPRDRPFVWWCNLNEEAERLAAGIPGAVNLHGGL